ncbi:type II toxin-antitoxin system HipA family toxin [Bosea sp. PAMC 26642]|uniref:type II toxin-antitoxin system HipA family toxin n=1 Tax=Bosea sp. (strain PAMC 26642) TaxID=1792307 RepID=UPI0009E6CD07|nr:type II toxin-antitoxin system HipA family toxin [Bosea sp. PAMC 26642]
MTDIFYETLRVAAIAEVDREIALTYDPDWLSRPAAFPISVTMPLRAEPYGARDVVPWLANLLPENHLQQIGQILGVAPQDILGILSQIGRDTAGALSFGFQREGKDSFHVVESEDELERIISDLPIRPMLAGERGVSMSLAGAQEKLGVALVDGRIAIPLDGTPSTHILKPDVATMKASVQNEAFCLTLAGLVGLDAAKVTTGRAKARSYLLVERYDRSISARGTQRIHQEDLAQTLGIFPRHKYEYSPLAGQGEVRSGPGLVDLFGAVERHVGPGARLTFLDALIFNTVCGNTDAHAKNYSILIGASGSTRLAPLYDVLCAKIWPHITTTMAQKLGERRIGAEVLGSDWQILARSVGLNSAQTLKAVDDLCGRIVDRAGEAFDAVVAMPAGGHELLDRTRDAVIASATAARLKLAQRREGPRKDPRGPRAVEQPEAEAEGSSGH